jgi:hypothetical protein
LHWRLERFDLAGLYTPPAIRLLARCTEGRFAAVDCLCQMTLLLCKSREADQVDVTLVREAAHALRQRRRLEAPGAIREPDGYLIVSRGGRILRRVPLGRRLLIGRNSLNDLVLDSDYLSRHHAVVMGTDGAGYYLSDLNSVNGLLLNGRPVHAAPLSDGDVICLGPFRIKVKLGESIPMERPDEHGVEGLPDTMVMPTPEIPEPAHLKIVK